MVDNAVFQYREEWLTESKHRLVDSVLLPQGISVNENSGVPIGELTRVSMSYPSTRAVSPNARIVGQTFEPSVSGDGHSEIFISPYLDDPKQVLGVLLHELLHTAAGHADGHGTKFKALAKQVGLETKDGKASNLNHPNPTLEASFESIIAELGPYPHASLDYTAAIKKQGTRMLLVRCLDVDCPSVISPPKGCKPGYATTVAQAWLNVAVPNCPVCDKPLTIIGNRKNGQTMPDEQPEEEDATPSGDSSPPLPERPPETEPETAERLNDEDEVVDDNEPPPAEREQEEELPPEEPDRIIEDETPPEPESEAVEDEEPEAEDETIEEPEPEQDEEETPPDEDSQPDASEDESESDASEDEGEPDADGEPGEDESEGDQAEGEGQAGGAGSGAAGGEGDEAEAEPEEDEGAGAGADGEGEDEYDAEGEAEAEAEAAMAEDDGDGEGEGAGTNGQTSPSQSMKGRSGPDKPQRGEGGGSDQLRKMAADRQKPPHPIDPDCYCKNCDSAMRREGLR